MFFVVKLGLIVGFWQYLCAQTALGYGIPRKDLDSPGTLAISNATFTSKWIEGTDLVQIIEMIIENTDSTNWLTTSDKLNVTVVSDSVNLVQPGTLLRLRPGDRAIVQVGVKNKSNVSPGTTCSATVVANWGSASGNLRNTTATVTGPCGIGNYVSTDGSLEFHSSPDWFNDAKYGIFFHWGLYSAPAYGYIQPNESYAEWYWKRQHDPTYETHTYQYHLETYGESFNYDDFVSNFTASKFDPRSWLELIDAAGAQYFVPVTKHHDGFALFNFSASVSKRSSVHYGPKRDFIKELLSTAKTDYPHLRRGTYFSLPEWYNPLYTKYAQGEFLGGPPTNPYTGETIEYTGFVNVSDFVTDIQLPQMEALAYDYETEIMWCDIGGANNSTILMSAWLNWARGQGRQVAFNNRCGLKGDYDTPEYQTNANTVARKWESTRGMDPFSFGYNYMTPDDQYLTGYEIVQAVVDIVSKNGNFLLDVGPRNDGSIADIMVANLRDAGTWIKAHAESIYSTRYWLTTAGTGNLRYTTTAEAFYIHVLSQPNATVTISDPIPYLAGDSVTVVGGSLAGKAVPMTENSDGTYTLTVGSDVAAADKYVWTFRIVY
ncbi:alpha-L-fucosidase-domain-containing protein [Diplogelasinospora grovesii]|uniref:alpha-L-fucosidase n=1 Tax=Diplogelasinospora grovesii TaxID=303347 RepID=A0AAN6N539_9PEZI|nr:alpha-L-fucosidase-domain-containing protein [Diplogelasinospora grovesii]